jgi:hypothetical protein
MKKEYKDLKARYYEIFLACYLFYYYSNIA